MFDNIGIWLGLAGIIVVSIALTLRKKKASGASVEAMIQAGASVIDVRTPGEFAGGAYPKARNIPLDRLEAGMAKFPKDKPIVLYCASGARSGQAERMLKAAGFSNVVSAGGLSDMPR